MSKISAGGGVGIGATVRLRHARFLDTCNRCGICCERLVEWQMTQADPDDPRGQLHRGKCVYLDGNAGEGKTTSCEIRDGTVDIDTVPAHHKAYYLRECQPRADNPNTWPDPDDPAHWPESGTGTMKPRGVEDTGCSFRKVVIIKQS